jgi:DME family drug/metabolite transporter
MVSIDTPALGTARMPQPNSSPVLTARQHRMLGAPRQRESRHRLWVRARVSSGSPAVVLAALIWGTNGLAASFLPVGTPTPTVAALRLLVGGSLFLALARPGRLGPFLAARTGAVPLVTAAAAMAVYQVCYFTALDWAGVAVGNVVTMASVPVFTGIITACTARTSPSARWVVATALAITGSTTLTLARPDGRTAIGGVLCALAAGASYALFTTTCGRMLSQGRDCRTTMAIVLLTAGALLAPALVIYPAGWAITGRGIAVVGYLAGVSTVAAYLLYGRGLRITPATEASTLTLAEPACAATLGILVLGEPATAQTTMGLVLVTAALLTLTMNGTGTKLITRRYRRRRPNQSHPRHILGPESISDQSDDRMRKAQVDSLESEAKQILKKPWLPAARHEWKG